MYVSMYVVSELKWERKLKSPPTLSVSVAPFVLINSRAGGQNPFLIPSHLKNLIHFPQNGITKP